MIARLPRLLLLPLVAGLLAAAPARAADERCNAPDGAAGTPAPLPQAAAALKPGGTMEVLVVGSATVFGPEAAMAATVAAREAASRGAAPGSTPPVPVAAASPGAFPMIMGRIVQASVPGSTVHVTVRGARSLSASDMLDLLRTAVKERPYQLVVWQTGTLEAVRNVQPGDFAQTLADGQQAVHDAGADLVLVDPQYSRFLQTNANLDPYLQAFGTAAAAPGVVWFRRYDLMRGWVGNNQIDLEHTAKTDRGSAVEVLHRCLGTQLAEFLMQSLRS